MSTREVSVQRSTALADDVVAALNAQLKAAYDAAMTKDAYTNCRTALLVERLCVWTHPAWRARYYCSRWLYRPTAAQPGYSGE